MAGARLFPREGPRPPPPLPRPLFKGPGARGVGSAITAPSRPASGGGSPPSALDARVFLTPGAGGGWRSASGWRL